MIVAHYKPDVIDLHQKSKNASEMQEQRRNTWKYYGVVNNGATPSIAKLIPFEDAGWHTGNHGMHQQTGWESGQAHIAAPVPASEC